MCWVHVLALYVTTRETCDVQLHMHCLQQTRIRCEGLLVVLVSAAKHTCSLLQMLVRQEEEEQVMPSSSEAAPAAQQKNRSPLVTRHVPNRQMPADSQAASFPASLESQTSQVLPFSGDEEYA